MITKEKFPCLIFTRHEFHTHMHLTLYMYANSLAAKQSMP